MGCCHCLQRRRQSQPQRTQLYGSVLDAEPGSGDQQRSGRQRPALDSGLPVRRYPDTGAYTCAHSDAYACSDTCTDADAYSGPNARAYTDADACSDTGTDAYTYTGSDARTDSDSDGQLSAVCEWPYVCDR